MFSAGDAPSRCSCSGSALGEGSQLKLWRIRGRPLRSPSAFLAVTAAAAFNVVTAQAATSAATADEPSPIAIAAYARLFKTTDAVAREHLLAQYRGHGLAGIAREKLGDRFAGIWFDNQTGRYKLAAPSDAMHRARAAIAGTDAAGDADAVPVAYTWAELTRERDAVVRSFADAIMAGDVQVGLDDRRNAVVVRLSDAASSTRQAAVRDYAQTASVRVVIDDTPAWKFNVRADTCTYPDCSQPMRGGVEIGYYSQKVCTSGFYAWAGSRRYILTAGHCVNNAAPVSGWAAWDPYSWPYEFPMGSVVSYIYNQYGDAGLIDVTATHWDPSAWSPIVAAWGANEEHVIRWRDYSVNGQLYCRYGATTPSRCGYVLGHGFTIPETDDGQNYMIGNMSVASGCGRPGDSGGPLVVGTGAIGLHSSSSVECYGDGEEYFTEVRDAEYALGVTVANTGG